MMTQHLPSHRKDRKEKENLSQHWQILNAKAVACHAVDIGWHFRLEAICLLQAEVATNCTVSLV